jgi:hypothetical protein
MIRMKKGHLTIHKHGTRKTDSPAARMWGSQERDGRRPLRRKGSS